MKKLSILLALISTGLLLGSCRQSSFIAEDDVYSSGSSTVYANDRSNASYSNYVYSKESSSGTKSAYYNPEDTTFRDDSQQLAQGGTVVNNYYYGNDYMYNQGWGGSNHFRYRPYNVWWSWGYDPFFYPRWYWGPSYAWGWGYNSWGYGHGWGYNPYGFGYGYNPYAWGHGYGHNPYGWGGNCGIYGGGNVFINNGNIYNFGGQGMTTFTNTGGSFYKSGNQFIGKRPGMSGTSAPYTGPDKVKSAISSNGQPANVRNLSTADRTLKSQGKDIASASAPRVNRGTIQTEKLTEGSTPWSPRTTARNITPAKEGTSVNRVNGNGVKPTVNDRNTISNGTAERGAIDRGAVNRPSVPVNTRTENPATTRPSEGVRNQGNTRIDNNRQPTISRPVENQYNRSNTNPGNQRVAPQPSQQRQNMSQPASRPSNNRMQSPSSSPSRGGSYSSPSRGSSGGGSMSSPSRGGSSGSSKGGSSRGGGFSRP
jgi:hypothetical protein